MMLCSRLAPCCHTRAAVAALARLPAALHGAPRKAFGGSSSSSTGGGAGAVAPAPLQARLSSSRAAHVCRSYADPEVYSIAFNFRKFDVEVRSLELVRECRRATTAYLCALCGPPPQLPLQCRWLTCWPCTRSTAAGHCNISWRWHVGPRRWADGACMVL